ARRHPEAVLPRGRREVGADAAAARPEPRGSRGAAPLRLVPGNLGDVAQGRAERRGGGGRRSPPRAARGVGEQRAADRDVEGGRRLPAHRITGRREGAVRVVAASRAVVPGGYEDRLPLRGGLPPEVGVKGELGG